MNSNPTPPPTSEDIAVCAYHIWEHEGRPEGRALEHWLQAELQFIASTHPEEEARLALISSTSEIQLLASKRRGGAAAGKAKRNGIDDTKASAGTYVGDGLSERYCSQ